MYSRLVIFSFALLFFSASANAADGSLSLSESLGFGWPIKSSTPGPHSLYGMKDTPLEEMSGGYLKIAAIVDHRSVLNTQHVAVHAVIISTLLGDNACPPRRFNPAAPPSCPQQRVTIADTDDPERNTNYDVQVLIKPGEQALYRVGQIVDIDASVMSDEGYVILRKD